MLNDKRIWIVAGILLVLSIVGGYFAKEYKKQYSSECSKRVEVESKLVTLTDENARLQRNLAIAEFRKSELETKLKTMQKGTHTETRSADGSISIHDQWENSMDAYSKQIDELSNQLALEQMKSQTLQSRLDQASKVDTATTDKLSLVEVSRPVFRHWELSGGMASGEIGYYIPLGICDLGGGVLNPWNSLDPQWRFGVRF